MVVPNAQATTDKNELTTSWMWPAHHRFGMYGAYVDTGQGIVHWFDNMECQCMDDGGFAEQQVADFIQHGPPAGVTEIPPEVLAQMRKTATVVHQRLY